jgi:hypothetical protein
MMIVESNFCYPRGVSTFVLSRYGDLIIMRLLK